MTKPFNGFDPSQSWDYENGFYLTSPLTRLGKLLAHYELYKSIIHLCGEVVECGVYKAVSLIQFLTFRDLLEAPHSRKVIGFDAFGGFPTSLNDTPGDRDFIAEFERQGGSGISLTELNRVLDLKRLGNYELVPGDITQTIPDYVSRQPQLRIALLHIDVDVYVPTRAALDALYERVVPGGMIMLDDYGKVDGATRAIDEFMTIHPGTIQKLPISHIPAFIRKAS